MGKRKTTEVLYEQPLYEQISIVEAVGEEYDPSSPYKLLTIKGTASRGNYVNRNGRLYPTAVLENAVRNAQEMLEKGKLLGQVDHPHDVGSLDKTAIKFTKLYMEGDDMLFEGEVLATEDGGHLALLLRSGVGVGISTRGYGSVREIDGQNGPVYEVLSDYELKGIDCVLEESNEYGKIANFESKEQGGKEDMELTLEMLQTDYPELVATVVEKGVSELKDSIEADFEARVASAIEEKQAEIIEAAKQEVLESEEIKAISEERDQMKAVVEAIVEAVKPILPEAKSAEELDADLLAANEALSSEIETLQGIVETLKAEKAAAESALEEEKARIEQEKELQAEAVKVAEKINSLVEGHRFEGVLRQKLSECKTVEAVEAQFAAEDAFIASLVESTGVPTGVGIVEPSKDDSATELSEEVIRQKQLAGLLK